jgi:hypothetical protein
MTIRNRNRNQAKAVMYRIIIAFDNWNFLTPERDAAENGVVSVFIKEDNEVEVTSAFYHDALLLGLMPKCMRDRATHRAKLVISKAN